MKLLKPDWVSHDGNPIFSVAIHPDGSRFATGGQGKDSGVVVIWNMAPVRSAADEADDSIPKILCEMSNHLGCVNCVRWSVDGKWLASGGDDAIVMIWSVKYQGGGGGGEGGGGGGGGMFGSDLERWGCIHMLRGHNGDVLDLSWSPDQKYLASCSVDNTIVIWNARELPQKLATVTGHRGLVKGITWDPVGKYLASQSDDRSVRIWRTGDWSEETVITEPFRQCGGTTHILRLSWSPDGRYIVSAHALNNDGPTAQIIERGDWKMGVDLVGHRKAVEVVSFNPHLFFRDKGSKENNHGCIAVGSRDRSLSIWLTSLKRPLVVTHDMFVDSIIDISWSCDGYELMVCSTDGSLGYLSFSQKELGVRLPKQALDNLFLDTYGCARASNRPSLPSGISDILIEDPAMLKHQQKTQEPHGVSKPDQPQTTDVHVSQQEIKATEEKAKPKVYVQQLSQEPKFDSAKLPTITKQTETRTKDGKRRITPIMLTSQVTSSDSTPRPFTSSTSSQSKLSGELSGTTSVVRDMKAALEDEASGKEIGLLSPPAKPISFEPLSPKVSKTKPLAQSLSPASTKTSHKRRLLETEPGEPLPKAKRQKKHRSLASSPPPSSSLSKPGTPQKGGSTSSALASSHTKAKSSPVILAIPEPHTTLTVQLVAGVSSGLSVGEPLSLEVDNTKSNNCTITCRRGSEVQWSSSLLSHGIIATGNHCITCVASKDQTMCVFSSQSGRLLLARLSLPSPPHQIKVSDYFVMLVTAHATVTVWDLRKTELVARGTSFSHLLQRRENISLSDCLLTPTGTPVLTLSDSTSYLYHRGMELWMEVANSTETTEISGGMSMDFHSTNLTPLQRIQSIAGPSISGQSLSRLRDVDSKLSTAAYLESQISRSLSLQSPAEHQHWAKVYVSYLVKTGMEERLREFCMQWCQPGGGGGPQERGVIGFQTKNVTQEFLSVIAGNPKLQRLYCELRDAIDTTL